MFQFHIGAIRKKVVSDIYNRILLIWFYFLKVLAIEVQARYIPVMVSPITTIASNPVSNFSKNASRMSVMPINIRNMNETINLISDLP